MSKTVSRGYSKNSTKFDTESKVLEIGPLEDKFPCSRSKILDFLIVFDDYDYSISEIARHSGLSFKTALNEIRALVDDSFIVKTRTSGKSIMYKLNPDSDSVQLISKLAMNIAINRIKDSSRN
ncbi:MAG: winged helix-turn-helix domain-containing protein [Thaumarchaeota archaeon]|nr:winged helix-turn-helix domain-containing protein [Nitrososphaerota archaeon]